VTSILYRDTKRASSTEDGPGVQTDQPSPERDPAPGSKVNRVCQAVLKELQVRNPPNLQNIITANLCMDPPALDDALSVAAKILSEEGEERAEKVVEHICFLADVNKAYDHALGLYNLELTALVAQQSQQDPREYLPFVQSLSRLPELRRRFAIDDHLGRWEKAVVHLKDADAFDEFCAYMNKHKLYQSALRLYRYDEARVRTLTGLYADHLESTSDFRQAGLTYESLRNYTRASRCYRAAGPSCWRECLAAAAMQQDPPMRPAALTDLAIALADAVLEARDYQAASTIQLAYLSQPAEAVRSLCKGHHFAEAIRIAVTTTEPADQDLLSTVLDPGLLEALSSSTEFLADCRGQLQAQVPRVLELRRRALEDPLAFYEGERPARTGGGDEDDSLLLLLPDNVSVVSDAASRISTSASLFTRYTGKGEGGGGGSVGTLASNVSRASSKNRKRAEKKRARGRKGTVYEEEYLVNSVRRLVERVGAAKEEVERMVVALVRRGMAERARAVEGLMVEVLDGCRQAVETLWPGPRVDVKGQKKTFLNGDGAGHTTRQEGLLDEQRPPSPPSPPPVVPSFAKLSLLG
jgi:elongator complex protein 1